MIESNSTQGLKSLEGYYVLNLWCYMDFPFRLYLPRISFLRNSTWNFVFVVFRRACVTFPSSVWVTNM